MKRLQSRLIAAFLGVVLLTMLPISFYFYYSIDQWFSFRRELVIQSIERELSAEVEQTLTTIDNAFRPAANEIRRVLSINPNIADWFRNGEPADIFDSIEIEIEEEYSGIDPFFEQFKAGVNIHVLPQKDYRQMLPWLRNGWLYEKDKTVYYYLMFDLLAGNNAGNMEVIGGLFITIPMIEITDNPESYRLLLKRANRNTHVFGPSPFLLKDILPEPLYQDLYENHREIDIPSISIPWLYEDKSTETGTAEVKAKNDILVQAWFKPIINQDGHLTAIVMVSERIFDAWEMVGPTILQSVIIVSIIMIILAVLIARSISKPMYELVGVAKQMSQGDFSVRIGVKGTTEQQVLRQTFNQLAERITGQLNQLRQQTNKLELSNRELEDTQRFLQNILVNIHTGVMSVNRNGQINLINQVCRDILKIDKAENPFIHEAVQEQDLIRIIEHSLANCVCVYQQEVLYTIDELSETIPLQVSTVPMLHQGEFTGIVVTIHDLSLLRKLEAEVRRHDRLVSLGRMAGGLAHEIRNPLGIIRGSAEILKKRFGGQPGEEGLTEFIMDEVNRLSRVLTDFLTFARPPSPVMEPVSAQEMIDHILPYVQQSEKYVIQYQIQPDTPTLFLDMGLCKQAFLNLILNAQDAMPDGGTIWIKIRPVRVNEVMIEVIDKGMGVPAELIDRIFDPFVTSKDTGTGLGLSLVHQIISNQNGKIEVESVPGKGSCFRIIFPAYYETRFQMEPKPAATV